MTLSLKFSRLRILVVACLAVMFAASPALAQKRVEKRLDPVLRHRAKHVLGRSRVIVQFKTQADVRAITGIGGRAGRKLPLLQAHVADVANTRLKLLANDPRVERISMDRPAFATLERTGGTIGATLARESLGLTGVGVGVAVIDSGVTGWHDDLYMERGPGYDEWVPRVVHFKDFVNPVSGYDEYAFDDYGHGSHVAGIIAGNGYDSSGGRAGMAPQASIIGLKALDANGYGYVSDVIAAIDYAVAKRFDYNIRVINISAGAGVYESYETDPLALAAKRAVDAGIVVVAAAGNLGRNVDGEVQYGGITSPANAPWVLAVGAASHNGTEARNDDNVANFSSRGPTWIDFSAKPDIVAPGVGIESLGEPFTTLYERYAAYQLPGSDPGAWASPYLSLSGTSSAAPVVAGTVALMIQANPALTPNAVKGILQYTAQARSDDFLTQGAGYLNAHGAIRMARFFANPTEPLGEMTDYLGGEMVEWGRHIIWGNHRIGGGIPLPGSNAWAVGQLWGAATSTSGHQVVWGSSSLDNIVWSLDAEDNIVWGYMADDNIVWSMDDDNIVWSLDADNIVWSLDDLDNIVWSLANAKNVVWGEDCGGDNCDNIVWGMRSIDGRIWGTAEDEDNIVWSMLDENIVWSMFGDDNIVWSMADDNIVWSMGAVEPVLWPALPGH